MAVDVEMFQHLQKAGDAGLGAELFAQKTGMEIGLYSVLLGILLR